MSASQRDHFITQIPLERCFSINGAAPTGVAFKRNLKRLWISLLHVAFSVDVVYPGVRCASIRLLRAYHWPSGAESGRHDDINEETQYPIINVRAANRQSSK